MRARIQNINLNFIHIYNFLLEILNTDILSSIDFSKI